MIEMNGEQVRKIEQQEIGHTFLYELELFTPDAAQLPQTTKLIAD